VFASVSKDAAKESSYDMLLDFASGGDLVRHHEQHGVMPEKRAAFVTSGLLAGLAQVHAGGIVHRDVKPENVLLMSDGRAVLADFGVAARLAEGEKLTLRVGSLGYAAPEVLLGRSYGHAVDCFGAGAVLHFVLAGEAPFGGKDKSEITRNTCEGELDLFTRSLATAREPCRSLLVKLLCPQPRERATAEQAQAAAHRWFAAAKALDLETAVTLHQHGSKKECSVWRLVNLFRTVAQAFNDV
jgi:calcium/calmodulin-dependent protein kinase I